jgi:hypothetical protein
MKKALILTSTVMVGLLISAQADAWYYVRPCKDLYTSCIGDPKSNPGNCQKALDGAKSSGQWQYPGRSLARACRPDGM